MTSRRFIYAILGVFVTGTLLLLLMQYNYTRNISQLTKSNEKLLYELEVNNQLRELQRDLLAVESRIRGAILVNDIASLNGLDVRIRESMRQMDSLLKGESSDSTRIYLRSLYQIADEKLALRQRVIDSFNLTGHVSAESFREDVAKRMYTAEVNNATRKVYYSRQRVIKQVHADIADNGEQAQFWGFVMILLILGSETLMVWYIITRIRNQNELILQLDSSEKKLRELSAVKETFVANISHEIRTPMNAIMGFTNILKTKNRDPELNEFIEAMSKSGKNLLTIINDILDLSKIEAGMMSVQIAPVSIQSIAQSIQTLFREKVNDRRLQFRITVDNAIPGIIYGDPVRLTQILINIVGNAVKFTQKGSIALQITNKEITDNDVTLEFIVRDTGIGIPKEKLAKIFDRFIQVEDSNIREYGGTGLGLAIVKELIELQNGHIEVESKVDKGTTFRFVIPFRRNQHLNDRLQQDNVTFSNPDPFAVNILVVEDNQLNQTLIRHLLHEWKFSFKIAANGLEAIDLLQKEKFHLVLMDIQMPQMDGYTATLKIRNAYNIGIPIIAMTAHGSAGEREKCLKFGMNGYIAKPINGHELLRIITQFTGNVADRRKTDGSTNPQSSRYRFISLAYMFDISNGNKEYEKIITEQFLDAIPQDIERLRAALENQQYDSVKKIAHNMKTNISVLGLPDKLHHLLDKLENEPFDNFIFSQIFTEITYICEQALEEARHLYNTILAR